MCISNLVSYCDPFNSINLYIIWTIVVKSEASLQIRPRNMPVRRPKLTSITLDIYLILKEFLIFINLLSDHFCFLFKVKGHQKICSTWVSRTGWLPTFSDSGRKLALCQPIWDKLRMLWLASIQILCSRFVTF